jgi:hypothetical protein
MLTLNAEAHPLMNRFHKPGSERRSVVSLRPDEYEDWLTAKSPDEAVSGQLNACASGPGATAQSEDCRSACPRPRLLGQQTRLNGVSIQKV